MMYTHYAITDSSFALVIIIMIMIIREGKNVLIAGMIYSLLRFISPSFSLH